MNFDFEVFNRRSARITDEPMVTVQKGGTLSLNAAAAKVIRGAHGKTKKIPVELLFDAKRRVIGVRWAPEGANVYYLRKQPNSNSYLVAGRSFTNHYKIAHEIARRYQASVHDGKIVFICLDDPHTVVSRTKKTTDDELEPTLPLSDDSRAAANWSGGGVRNAVARLQGQHPEWGFKEIKEHMIETGFDFGGKKPGNTVNMAMMNLRRGKASDGE